MTSTIKGFLCSQDGTYNFPLMPKLTTIGRENCEILINNNSLDLQHAVIEYVEEDNSFLLHDLNTVNGTYVNECRIQNAAIRLTENDIIRFGFNGTSFQLVYQAQQATTIPPINLNGAHRQSTNQQLQIISQTLPSRGFNLYNTTSPNQQTAGSGIWANTLPNASLITIHNQPQLCCPPNNQFKPPATLRARPVSAGGFTTTQHNQQQSTLSTNKRIFKENVKVNSWVKGTQNSYVQQPVVDSETYRRDDDSNNTNVSVDQELKTKTLEIKELKEKIQFLQTQITSSSELEQVKRDKSIAVNLVNTMQKDLTNKDLTISKLAREIEGYKREIKERENTQKQLEDKLNQALDEKTKNDELNAKEQEINNFKTKAKVTESKIADLTKQILDVKTELDESKRLVQKHSKSEQDLRNELEHSKNQYIDMQRCERTVRIDLEQMKRTYEKFRNQIIQSVYSTPGVSNPSSTNETTDDDIIASWKQIIDDRNKHFKQINDLKQNLKNLEDELKSVKEATNKLNQIRDLIVNLCSSDTAWSVSLKSKLDTSFIDYKSVDSIPAVLNVIKEIFISNSSEIQSLEKRIVELNETNEKKLSNELQNKSQEYKSYIENIQIELVEKHQKELSDLKVEHESFVNLIKSDYTLKIEQLTSEITSHLAQIESFNSEVASLKVELETSKQNEVKLNELHEKLTLISSDKEEITLKYDLEIKDLESKLEASKSLEIKLQSEIGEYQSRICELKNLEETYNNKLNEATRSYNVELSIHKEQIKQHSLTIVNFEKELSSFREKEVQYVKRIELLEKQLKDSVGKPSQQQNSVKSTSSSSSAYSTSNTLESLKVENSAYKTRISEQDELIKTLRRDLAGASAKLSDCHGEMTEKQKRELERNKQLVSDQQKELSNTRAQLARLSEIVDKQTKQLDTLRPELTKTKALVDKYRVASEENGQLAVELRAKLEDVETQLKKFENVKKEEGKITSELTAVGAQCRGERHEQVITRQREALNELRQRIKSLEQLRPSVPTTQQQMQQQIMLLKKQLAEVRASQALTEDIAKHANLARGNEEGFLMIEEKTAHYETQTALENSEESYLTMLRTLGSLLDVSEMDGLRSMSNLPHDERMKLNQERLKSVETLCNKIKYLQESLQRKEQILKEYEIDLAKLRQAEFLLEKKSEQVDENQLNLRNKDDEIEYLKESLKNTKADLDRERLLNAAIKQKKNITISTERARKKSTDTLHHHCPPGDDIRLSQVKKEMNEKLKRKEYELKTLKSEIKEKSDELYNFSNRLTPKSN